ncbi:hypothetical protein [Mangrovihabitans endophyticus]|uniref:Uncharacterized protein n=1 Tax=Mangrovihabitans endophyticus TaxID=1751298 RepID=A0A8J3C4K0_9ACTN|nr:hypothetical protein [Mangrovihabitans endophyticus]GGL17752.1 hypothetical protein GCM10012284_60440 [Mangrovihabitans endophyticus]
MSAVDAGEVTGLDQCIAYAQHLAGEAGQHGPDGNEDYLGRLAAARVTGAGLTTGRDMQDAFAAAAAAAAAHTDQLTQQKTVQEAYDMTDGAGDKDFQRGEQSTPNRHEILRDYQSWGGRTSLAEQAATARRNLLGQLRDLTAVLAAGGAAEEGITAAELEQIRSAALRLAAAADTATDQLGGAR